MTAPTDLARDADRPPVVNTHVHVPPNFSAFTSVADAVGAAAAQGVRAMGISNFFDQQVYRLFAGGRGGWTNFLAALGARLQPSGVEEGASAPRRRR